VKKVSNYNTQYRDCACIRDEKTSAKRIQDFRNNATAYYTCPLFMG